MATKAYKDQQVKLPDGEALVESEITMFKFQFLLNYMSQEGKEGKIGFLHKHYANT